MMYMRTVHVNVLPLNQIKVGIVKISPVFIPQKNIIRAIIRFMYGLKGHIGKKRSISVRFNEPHYLFPNYIGDRAIYMYQLIVIDHMAVEILV